jgi:hypothetical protein
LSARKKEEPVPVKLLSWAKKHLKVQILSWGHFYWNNFVLAIISSIVSAKTTTAEATGSAAVGVSSLGSAAPATTTAATAARTTTAINSNNTTLLQFQPQQLLPWSQWPTPKQPP